MSVLQTPFVILAVLAWLAAPAKSLGEASQKEAMRRLLTPKAHIVLTNIGQPPEIPRVTPPPPPPDEPPVTGAAETPPPVTAPPTTETKDEAWWRDRITKARATLDHDQVLAGTLQTRINTLQADVVNRDNPAQQAKLRQELQKTLGELEKTRKQIEADQAAIKAIQDEARRLDVPAGWIR